MANEPSGAGLVILTGLAISAVVGLYAYDAIPRRSGPAPANEIAWPQWQSNPSDSRSYDAAPPPQAAQSAPQEPAPTDQRYPSEPSGSYQQSPQPQQGYPQEQQQGYPQQPAQQDNYPQDVPTENGPPTQSQYQQPQQQPNGQQPY